MHSNHLKLNHGKTEFLVLCSKYNDCRVENVSSIKIGESLITNSKSVRNIGAILDTHMSMVDQINSICRSCYPHIRSIGRIRHLITKSAAEKLVHAFISSRLDQNNSLLYGIPMLHIRKLQRVQNHAARIVTLTAKYVHISPVLKELHWLPVIFRIRYKILLLTFKCIHGLAPSYLSGLITVYKPARELRSQNKVTLRRSNFTNNSYGYRAFQTCAPQLWNELPDDIQICDNVNSFKSLIKTHLFRIAFD